MKDTITGHWLVLSHMEYAYDSMGRVQNKHFYLRSGDGLALALQYTYEYRYDTSMIETRLDCNGVVCRNDMRKILSVNPRFRDSLETTYGWNAQKLQWEYAWQMRHWFDATAKTDTMLYTGIHGDFERRIVLQNASKRRWFLQMKDSSGNWLTMEWSACKWERNHPVFCRVGRKDGVTEQEQWYEYDVQDSLRQIQTRKSGTLRLELHENDRHGHWVRGNLGENVKVERKYR